MAHMTKHLLARIQLLQSQGYVETLATPMLLASNNKSAQIFIGEERVLVRGIEEDEDISSVSTNRTTRVKTEIREIGNRLNIWPRINADQTVTLDIDQEISTVLVGTTTIPTNNGAFAIDSVQETTLKLTVIAKNGQSVNANFQSDNYSAGMSLSW